MASSYNDPFLKELEDISESDNDGSMNLQDNSEEIDYQGEEEVQPSLYASLASNAAFKEHIDSLSKDHSTNIIEQIKRTNDYLRRLGPEIQIVFKLCRDAYHSRFSELETIITNAFDFARVVKSLGNEVDSEKVQDLSWLSNQTKMSLTVAS